MLFFLNVNYINSLIGAADWLKLPLQQFHKLMLQRLSSFDRDILVTILQRLSPSGRNILVTKMYVQITKTKRKLFNTKHNIINRHPVILKYLDSPFIPQYNTLTLQCRGKKMMIHDCTLLREKCTNTKFFLVRIWILFTQ